MIDSYLFLNFVQVVRSPEIFGTLAEVPHVRTLLHSLHGCKYADFFPSLVAVFDGQVRRAPCCVLCAQCGRYMHSRSLCRASNLTCLIWTKTLNPPYSPGGD